MLRWFERIGVFLIFVAWSQLSPVYGQWCCSDSTHKIEDRKTITSKLQISGASVDNLADPRQGVCGVRLQFQHKFVGDVTMELISPSGQRVKLLGPAGNSGFTTFTNWYITLVPCGETAVPDPGFKPRWDNEQSWGLFGKYYNGTYYPFQGCLEDFNAGTVNGTWTLSVSDEEIFYEGELLSFCILFCDPSGINCSECSPNGGYFNVESKSYCEGDPGLQLNDRPIFSIFVPDPSSYGYKYIITQNDTIYSISDLPDATGLRPGKYLVCGISYLLNDSIKLPKPGQLMSKYREELLSNKLGLCADLSKSCIGLDIYPVYKDLTEKVRLCRGDSIFRNGNAYHLSGTYRIPYKTIKGCDSTVTLDLEVIDFQIVHGPPDTINCNHPVVHLDLTKSVISSNARIIWTTVNGIISDSTNLLNIAVSDSGEYKVLIVDGNCRDSAVFTIVKTDLIPDLKLSADTLRCNASTARLNASSHITNPKFQWSDGTRTLGMDSVLVVNLGGKYYVTVTDAFGCFNYDSIDVFVDTSAAQLSLSSNPLTCRDTLVWISYQSSLNGKVIHWTHQNLIFPGTDTLWVTKPGVYYLRYMADNGCESLDSITVVSLSTKPDYSVQLDTLDCNNQLHFILNDRTQSVLDSIVYLDPLLQKKIGLNPEITLPGWYSVQLWDTMSCRLDTSFFIPVDTTLPSFLLSVDTLSCLKDSVQLILNLQSPNTAGVSFNWTGPPGYQSTIQQPFVYQSGVYTVTVKGANGCMFTDSIMVLENNDRPDLNIDTIGSLNCKDTSMELSAMSTKGIRFLWSGPGNFMDTSQTIQVNRSGIYTVTVYGTNGCSSVRNILIEWDTLKAIDFLVADTLNCFRDSGYVELKSLIPIDSLTWSGPSSFSSQLTRVKIGQGGRYEIQVWGSNHCQDSASIEVIMDTMVVQPLLIVDTLGCNVLTGMIQIVDKDTSSTHLWITPKGDSLMMDTLQVVDTGIYLLVTFATNGCLRKDMVYVPGIFNGPEVKSNKDTITCIKAQIAYGLEVNEPGLNYLWRGPGNFTSQDSLIIIRQGGWYYYTVTNSFGCSTNDSLYIHEINGPPHIQFNAPIFNCSNYQNARLTASTQDALLSFFWVLPGGNHVADTVISVNQAGNYIFTATNLLGCQSNDTLTVSFDTLSPRLNALFVDTINCANRTVFPIYSLQSAISGLLWEDQNGDTTSMLNPGFSQPGNYSMKIIGLNQCVLDTHFIIHMDTTIPRIQTHGDTLDCLTRTVELTLSTSDSLNQWIWKDPKNRMFNQRKIQVMDSGWYFLRVTGINGCEVFDSLYVHDFSDAPVIQLDDFSIPCLVDSISLFAVTQDSMVQYQWTGPGNFRSANKFPVVRDTGIYRLIVTNAFNCQSIDSCEVIYKREPPVFQVIAPVLNCRDSIGQFRVQGDTSGIRHLWTSGNWRDSTNWEPQIQTPGVYTFNAVNSSGCRFDSTFLIVLDTMRPQPMIKVLDSLICLQKAVGLRWENPNGQYKIQWSTANGRISGPSQLDTCTVESPGTYFLEITNPSNGCVGKVNVEVVETIPNWHPVVIEAMDPTCGNEQDGWIQVVSTNGSLGPLSYSIDQNNFQSNAAFNGLRAGAYSLRIKGRFDCVFDTIIQLDAPPMLTLDVGRDTLLRLGQTHWIQPQTNVDLSTLKSIIWEPATRLSCDNCISPVAQPSVTTTYRLILVDSNDCQIQDELTIEVFSDPQVYIPNVFSPNGDQINDFLGIEVTHEIRRIKEFSIFDRWGNLVFSKKDFDSRNEKLIWDGSFNGQKMMPAVFVYSLVAELDNGGTKKFSGEVTLLR